MTGLRIDVAHASVSFDLPALDAMIVVARMGAADLDQRIARWLLVSRLIHASALEDGLLTIPSPWQTKSGMAFGEYRFLQFSSAPCSSTVDRHLNLHDSSPSAPRQTADLLKTWTDLLAP